MGVVAHLEDLLSRALDVRDRLAILVATGEAASSRVWLHLDSPDTGFAMEADLLRDLARLGSLEVDVYS